MSKIPWRIRAANAKDRKLLAEFSCADPTVDWQVQVETHVRNDLLDWALVAHERTTLVRNGNEHFPATKLEVVAVAKDWQGKKFSDRSRVSDVVVSAAMADISSRKPKRDERVFAVVHRKNVRSMKLLRKHGLVEELEPVNDDYLRLISAAK